MIETSYQKFEITWHTRDGQQHVKLTDLFSANKYAVQWSVKNAPEGYNGRITVVRVDDNPETKPQA
jgi:hypothetical protein